jgi:hypothetical protein
MGRVMKNICCGHPERRAGSRTNEQLNDFFYVILSVAKNLFF